MIVIHAAGRFELKAAPQDVKAAWRLAHALAHFTGIPHYVGRI